jgi:2-dehydropantoate 2-reductase
MRIVVVGAGQMGSLYAAAFLENGHQVLLFDSDRRVVEAVNAAGLAIDRPDGHRDSYSLRAVSDPADIEPEPDVALFMVKGHATRDAAENVKPRVARCTVLTLQNGLGNEQILRDVFPDSTVLIGVSVHSVLSLGPGRQVQTGAGKTFIGPGRAPDLEEARRVATAMEGPSFPVVVLSEREMRHRQWTKFASNCATLPVSALTGLTMDGLEAEPRARELMEGIVRETCAIARAHGIDLEDEEPIALLHNILERSGGRASMLGDVLAHRKTEIETINGAAVALARSHGMEAPFNAAMYALVKGLEATFEAH